MFTRRPGDYATSMDEDRSLMQRKDDFDWDYKSDIRYPDATITTGTGPLHLTTPREKEELRRRVHEKMKRIVKEFDLPVDVQGEHRREVLRELQDREEKEMLRELSRNKRAAPKEPKKPKKPIPIWDRLKIIEEMYDE